MLLLLKLAATQEGDLGFANSNASSTKRSAGVAFHRITQRHILLDRANSVNWSTESGHFQLTIKHHSRCQALLETLHHPSYHCRTLCLADLPIPKHVTTPNATPVNT